MNDTAQPLVYVVDDDNSFRKAITRFLTANGFRVKAFESAAVFLESTDASTCGCAVVDLRMPGLSGLDVQAGLAARGCSLPIVFLTGEGDIPSSVQAMRAGAEDFLEKRAPKEQLMAAVQRALERNTREREARARAEEHQVRLQLLSEREREVLGHVVRGRLNKQIAADLGIHERTVKLHRTAITTKLGVASVAELTLFAREAGMLESSPLTFPKGQ